MIHLVFAELLLIGEIYRGQSRLILCTKEQFLGKELLVSGWGEIHHLQS